MSPVSQKRDRGCHPLPNGPTGNLASVGRLEDVSSISNDRIGRSAGGVKKIMSLAQVFPVPIPPGTRVGPHILVGHSEGEDMHPDEGLTASEGGGGEHPKFFDDSIGHGVATDGYAISVDHEVTAGAPLAPVISVWKA